MNIICGDALGVSCGTWIAFWNGAIGAFVAAVMGGLVALVVVRLTNAQQRRGVERAVEIAAIADFVSALNALDWDLRHKLAENQILDPGSYTRVMGAAATRLSMCSRETEPLSMLLVTWPLKVSSLVICHRMAVHQGRPFTGDIRNALADAANGAMVQLPRYTHRDAATRTSAVRELAVTDRNLQNDMDKFVALLGVKV